MSSDNPKDAKSQSAKLGALTPIGFAGLDSYVSNIEISAPNLFASVTASDGGFPGTSPLPKQPQQPQTFSYKVGQWLRKKWDNMSRMEVVFGSIVLGYFSLLIVSTINFHHDTNSKPIVPTTGPNVLAKPTEPPLPTIGVKHFYTLRSSEGNTFEIEAPANSSAVDLNRLGQSRWQPPQPYYPEEKPAIGSGIALNDNEIRYCKAQKIRLDGWEKTIDNYVHESVAAFNAQVEDYNARCGHFKYREGALQRVETEVNSRASYLEVDGRLHRGPNPPPTPPTFKKISSRVETIVTGSVHPRCKGSNEVLKCEVLERKLEKESSQLKQNGGDSLEQERQRNMAIVNGGLHPRCKGSYEVQKCEELERKLETKFFQQRQGGRETLEQERQRNMAIVNGSQ